MKINLDRLSKLAGLPVSNSARLNENGQYEEKHHHEGERAHGKIDDAYEMAYEADHNEGDYHNEGDLPFDSESLQEDEGVKDDADGIHELDDNVMLEIDEKELVSELRRMKKIMQESKRRKQLSESKRRRRQQAIQEAKLKQVIDEEVRNVLDEIQYGSDWMYGDNKPTRSKRGFTHQGSFLKGFGFK
jgi:hypothetical protein